VSIDKQRIAAVAALEALGFSYTTDRGWLPPLAAAGPHHARADFTAEADAMHSLLAIRSDALVGSLKSEALTELELITSAVEAYEAKRWPRGKIPGGKG
jgi:hypothetical protein